MTEPRPIKKAGVVKKMERRLLRHFNNPNGAGMVSGTFLTIGAGFLAIGAVADKDPAREQGVNGTVYAQQYRAEAEQIVRDAHTIRLVSDGESLRVADEDRARAAAIDARASDLTRRIAFNMQVSESNVGSITHYMLRQNQQDLGNPRIFFNSPVISGETRDEMRRTMLRNEYRDEAMAELRQTGHTAATPENLQRLNAIAGEIDDTRMGIIVAALFLGIPLGGTGLLMTGQHFAARRLRKVDQQERSEKLDDLTKTIKQTITPKTNVHVSFGKVPKQP